jgi:hypothetical protein
MFKHGVCTQMDYHEMYTQNVVYSWFKPFSLCGMSDELMSYPNNNITLSILSK